MHGACIRYRAAFPLRGPGSGDSIRSHVRMLNTGTLMSYVHREPLK